MASGIKYLGRFYLLYRYGPRLLY